MTVIAPPSPPAPTFPPHRWWAIAVCLALGAVCGLGAVVLLLALKASVLAVLAGGFGVFSAGTALFVNLAKAGGLVC